jgi:hypothetical protein
MTGDREQGSQAAEKKLIETKADQRSPKVPSNSRERTEYIRSTNAGKYGITPYPPYN